MKALPFPSGTRAGLRCAFRGCCVGARTRQWMRRIALPPCRTYWPDPEHRPSHNRISKCSEIVRSIFNAHFRASPTLMTPLSHLLKRSFGTMVQKLLLVIRLTPFSNSPKRATSAYLGFQGLNNEKSIADPFCTGSVHGRRYRAGQGIQGTAFWCRSVLRTVRIQGGRWQPGRLRYRPGQCDLRRTESEVQVGRE
ncbi:hypothetical protein EMIT0357P_10571 [Pseudomonas marginalis]